MSRRVAALNAHSLLPDRALTNFNACTRGSLDACLPGFIVVQMCYINVNEGINVLCVNQNVIVT